MRVWDLPTRLFHWALVATFACSWTTGSLGGGWLDYHFMSGYMLTVLLLFRIGWGICGGQHARFASFLRGPRAMLRYAAGLMRPRQGRHVGHNPLGGAMIVTMLAALLLQASLGLFADDDILAAGPLAPLLDARTRTAVTAAHRQGANVLLLLVAVHVAAVLAYWVVKRENLVLPMITGRKPLPARTPDAREAPLWLAPCILNLALFAFIGLLLLAGRAAS